MCERALQVFSAGMLDARLCAIRNMQIYQERFYSKDGKQVHDYGSIREDGRVKTLVQLLKKGTSDRARECDPSHASILSGPTTTLVTSSGFLYAS